MERFKEKKPDVVMALREVCDAIYQAAANLKVMREICAGFLTHKTPIVRIQVTLFLAQCFTHETTTKSSSSEKILMLYLPPLMKVNKLKNVFKFILFYFFLIVDNIMINRI